MENEPMEQPYMDPSAQAVPVVQSNIKRDAEKPGASRSALVKSLQQKVEGAKKHWSKAFDRMKEDTNFYMGKQWSNSDNDERYVANIIQRHVGQRVSALYAKNPKFVAKRRETLDFAMWEGDMSSFQAVQTAMQSANETGMPADPIMVQTLQDAQQGFERRRMLDRVAKTMEIVARHQISEQQPPFKGQMKQLVRRVCVNGIGFLKLGYHRAMEKRPEDADRITDITEQLATLDRLKSDRVDDKFSEDDAKCAQLKLMLQALQAEPDVIIKEGVVFDFPASHTIIIDPKCRQMSGFVGANWIAQEFILDSDDIKEIYGVDIGNEFTAYKDEGSDSDGGVSRVAVWEIYSKKDGLLYVIADGYCDFLKEPAAPELELERFWPFFPLIFNEVESERDVIPPSDVRLLMPIQKEYNRARQGLREQRFANRPLYATYEGALTEKDITNLQNHQANSVIKFNNMSPGQAINSIIQPFQHTPIDPALYDTSMLLDDMMRVVGSQEANLGGTSNSTATEVSVAEGSRMSSMSSNVDDLEDFLGEIARATGQVLMEQMDQQTVMEIAGPGAVWPQLTANEISRELMLEVEAGSNGRPNRAIQMQNFERIAPILLQIPGMNPEFMAKEALKRMDDGMDVTDAIRAALPSIVAMNAQKQLATGNPTSDPASQGAAGATNVAPSPMAAGADGPTLPAPPSQIRANGVQYPNA